MNKKLKFILLIGLYIIIGFAGFLSAKNSIHTPDFSKLISIYFPYDVVYFIFASLVILSTLLTIISFPRLSKLEKENHDTEEISNPAEILLGKMLIYNNYSIMLCITWIALAISQMFSVDSSEVMPFLLANDSIAVIFLFSAIVLQYYVFKRFNHTYPKRSFDMFAKNPQQAAFEKMDEGEKWVVYRASYQSFKIVDKLLLSAIAFFVLYSIFFSFAIVPIIVISLIWMLQKTIYYYEALKLGS